MEKLTEAYKCFLYFKSLQALRKDMTYEWSLIQNAVLTAKREARTEHGAI